MNVQSYNADLAKKERVFRWKPGRWIFHLFLTRARWMGLGIETFNECGPGWKRWNVRLKFGCGNFQVMRFPKPPKERPRDSSF